MITQVCSIMMGLVDFDSDDSDDAVPTVVSETATTPEPEVETAGSPDVLPTPVASLHLRLFGDVAASVFLPPAPTGTCDPKAAEYFRQSFERTKQARVAPARRTTALLPRGAPMLCAARSALADASTAAATGLHVQRQPTRQQELRQPEPARSGGVLVRH